MLRGKQRKITTFCGKSEVFTHIIVSESRQYRFNPETLLYEIEKVSRKSRLMRVLMSVVVAVGLAFLGFWITDSVLGIDPPKTALLKRANARWTARTEFLSRKLDGYAATLNGLAYRDNDVYRNVFGMNPISESERNAGFGGVNRYEHLDPLGQNSLLKSTTLKLDILTKKTYIQSKSFDDISSISKRAGEMASCIPAVPPINTKEGTYRLSSSYGYRSDPITGRTKMHTGFDFACPPGNPIYATGDGVVESVSFELFGYGNSVIINHGFGYKTRYAHMKDIYVVEGMKLKRGENIGSSGNSGRSTGPHLHYEVFYRGAHVNPYNYFDMSMPPEEYKAMTDKAAADSKNVLVGRGKTKRMKF